MLAKTQGIQEYIGRNQFINPGPLLLLQLFLLMICKATPYATVNCVIYPVVRASHPGPS